MLGEVIGKISTIAYRPVKGAGTIEVKSAHITPEGIVGDKDYAIVRDQPDQRGIHLWISQRNNKGVGDQAQSLGILALIKPYLTETTLFLSWDGKDSIAIPRDRTGRELTVQVWNDIVGGAIDQGDNVAEWLSDHLKFGARLVRAGSSFDRPVSQKWHPNTHKIRFQDSYPLHWFTQESIDDLNQKIEKGGGKPVYWTRFRPNIIVEGTPYPSFEHKFYEGAFGEVPVVNVKPCDRCPVPLIDQRTGERTGAEPLKTLGTFKRWRKPDNKVFVIFGENTLPLKEGRVAVGDEVTLVSFRNPPLTYGGAEVRPA